MTLCTCPKGQGKNKAPNGGHKNKIFLLIAFYRVATGYIKSEYDIEGLGKNLFGRVQLTSNLYPIVISDSQEMKSLQYLYKSWSRQQSINKSLKLALSKAHKMVYLVNVYIPFKNFQIQRVIQIVKTHETTSR